MSLEEWIGSIISLLGLAALFFLNQRQESSNKKEPSRQSLRQDEDEEDEEEDVWQAFLKEAEGPKPKIKKIHSPSIKQVKPLKVEKSPPLRKPPPVYKQEELYETDDGAVMHSSRITRLKRVSLAHGELSEEKPRVKALLQGTPSLKTMIISHTIIERPKF